MKIQPEIQEVQYEFINGKWTANAIFLLRILSEKAIETQNDVYLCFTDFEKAFITMKFGEMMKNLARLMNGEKEIRVFRILHYQQWTAVRV